MSLKPYLSGGTPESSKRLIGWQSATVLAIVALALTFVFVFRGCHEHWGISDGGLVTIFMTVIGSLTWLAKRIYLKPEAEPDPGPSPEVKQ